ncbi:MAG: hypothetical protein ACFB2W_14060 [Leptolyngbyaceae cyanobacterium]
MGDSQGNPFIGNPFMQGGKKKPAADPEPSSASSKELPLPPLDSLSDLPPPKTDKPATKKKAKALSKSTATKSRSSPKRKQVNPPAAAPPSSAVGKGYKVQVLAKIPMPANTNMPSRDYLWFAVYPIIPRVGDCLFHDGRYFRVDAVFLYENTNASWCADLEVSYYTRRQ